MALLFSRPTHVLALAACLVAAAVPQAQGGQASFALLDTLHASSEAAGTLLYRADTCTQRTLAGALGLRHIADNQHRSHRP